MIDRIETGRYFCEHCGHMKGVHYCDTDSGCEWCPCCAFANDLITEEEADADEEQNSKNETV